MLKEQTDLYTSIILITIVFFVIVTGLIALVATYYRKKKSHLDEKKMLNQKFESELLQTQIEVQEQTMQTIASNLHDNIGQLLSLTNITLGSINISDSQKTEIKINASVELVNKSIKELRELAKLLQGEQLIQNGIAYAIEQEINWLRKTDLYNIQFENSLTANITSSPQKNLVILRLFQEISNNIIKHAKATEIYVMLYHANDHIFLNIEENGVGFNYPESKRSNKGLGLTSIEKRVNLVNGLFNLESTPLVGTKISIKIPYP